MNDELFDVVDENDKPTGQKATKKQVHTGHLIHRVAAVLVFKPDGKLLVQPHKQFNGRFDHSVGGHVGTGEDYLTAARREMLEEVGLITPLEEIAIVRLTNKHFDKYDKEIRHMYGVFKTEAPENWKFEPNEEVEQLIEMELGEIVELMNREPDKFLNGFLTTLGAYLRVTKSPLKIIAYGKNWGEL